MGMLGNYVHYTWANYEKAGTYHDQSNWKNSADIEQRSNYDEEGPFNIFIASIGRRAQNVQKYNVKELENQYNRLRMDQFDAFKRLQKTNPVQFLALLEKVVVNANLGRGDPKLLAQVLTLDDDIQNVTTAQIEALGEHPTVRKIKQLAKAVEGTEKSYLETVWQRCKDTRALVDTSPEKAILEPQLEKIEARIQRLESAISKNKQKFKKFSYIKDKNSLKEYKTIIPRELARSMISELLAIAQAADISNILNKLQGSFTEIMGTSLRPMVRRLAIDSIQSTAMGLNKSRPDIKAKPGLNIYLDQVVMEKEFENWAKKTRSSAEQFQLYAKDGNKITFKTDYETQDKKDFVLEWQGKEVAVSAKAYDLSVVDFYDRKSKERIPNFIHLQDGTSLLMLLLNIEQNGYSPLGTHFLNIFAKHGKEQGGPIVQEEGDYSRVRKVAQDALLVGILYNALTGGLSGKMSNTFADILMIEDKSKALEKNVFKVRFYNIATIIGHIINNIETAKDDVYITPSLATLRLNNDWSNDNAKTRITKLLLDARQKKFSVGLTITSLSKFRET